MSDEQTGTASYGQEEGTPSEPIQEQQPQYVTRDDLKKFGDEIIEQTKRAVQGLTDKQESRVEKRLKQWEQQLGFAPTPQLREQARTQLALQELEQLDGERPAQVASQPLDPKIKEANKKLFKLLAQHDADLDELQGIDMNPATNPPDQFLQQVEAKLKSLHPAAPATPQQNQPANLAHVPTLGASGTPIGGTREEQLTKRLMELQEKELDPRFLGKKDLKKEREDILAELRSLGK